MSNTVNLILQWTGTGLVVCAAVGWLIWKKTRAKCARTGTGCDCGPQTDQLPLCKGCVLYDNCNSKAKIRN